MSGNTSATVLVVDDEPAIVDGHAAHLEARYGVRRAYDGSEALELLDDEIDVVLLDRRMPGLSGERVLERIRARDLHCRVAMLTGVEPDLDILDLGFDDYLTKPIRKEELFDVVERMLQRTRYERRLQEFFALASKAAAIESEHDPSTLESHEEYGSMQSRLETMRAELDETLEALPTRDGYVIATRPPSGDISN